MNKEKNISCLVILDGFGYPTDLKRSAILPENTKNIRGLAKKYTWTLIGASEGAVGLPKGQTGTSEVGHLTIGTGRITKQPLVRINDEIKNKSFFNNPVFMQAMKNAKKKGRSLHLMGIPTDGGVHGHINHMFALLDLAKQQGVKNVFIHFFTDGRDVPPKSAKKYITKVEKYTRELGVGKIATVTGRFYSLDRDNNWDRVEHAYNAMVYAKGVTSVSATDAVQLAYTRGETDEFISPTVVLEDGRPVATIKKGDSIISFNYRADREKQLAYAFDDTNKLSFGSKDLQLTFVCMCEYDKMLKNYLIAYPPVEYTNGLSEYLSKQGYKQLKVAETEKFPYVGVVFNAGRKEEFPHETRIIIPSEKMQTYISYPQMGAREVARRAVEGILSQKYDVVVINFANPDMVGHSGDIDAAKKAIQIVDMCVKQVIDAVLKVGGNAIVTADHGNSDIMMYEDGSPHTSHTVAKVPFIVVDKRFIGAKLKTNGTLADIAPTLLDMIGLEKPVEMTGNSLLPKTKNRK